MVRTTLTGGGRLKIPQEKLTFISFFIALVQTFIETRELTEISLILEFFVKEFQPLMS